jgi:hypothetical protein
MARYSQPLLRRFFCCAAKSASVAGGGSRKKNIVFLGSPQVLATIPETPNFEVWSLISEALGRASGGRLGPGHAARRFRLPGLRIPGRHRRDAAPSRQEQG